MVRIKETQKDRQSHRNSGPPATEIDRLIPGYIICARAEGKSPKTIDIVTQSVTYMRRFLDSAGLSTDVRRIGRDEFRAYIIHLQERKCFADHPLNRARDRGLSGHTISASEIARGRGRAE